MNFGHKIIRLESIDSTNNYTANQIKQGSIVSGTVILADEQSSGKGQRGASWHSEPGLNLLFSLYIKPDNLAVDQQVNINYLTSLSIVEILRKIGISAKVKWPNDIYVGKEKIAGILIENFLQNEKINHLIIGIGLNLNQKIFENLNATSVAKVLGQFYPLNEILFSLLEQLNENWKLLTEGKPDFLKSQYLSNLSLLDELAEFEDQGGKFWGVIKGVSQSGKLQIEKEQKVSEYDLKEIKFIL